MIYQAHAGVSTENPENTMPAFICAARQGYGIIEADVSVTKDFRFVFLHDNTLNRTARNSDGEKLPDTVNISDITLEEAEKSDFGIYFSQKFKGTKITTLEEGLRFAEESEIVIKIDNKHQAFSDEQRKLFYECLKPYEKWASLTFSSVEMLKDASGVFNKMHFHYDGEVTKDVLCEISSFLEKERLTVWLPLKSEKTAWVKTAFADEELSALVKQYARLGLWILTDEAELSTAEKLGADVVETNGRLKPVMNEGVTADMHTHSESSHDSECKISDMYLSQKARGTKFFAVTDHFDTYSHKDYDIFSPIAEAHEKAAELNEKFGGGILSGIEISEGFRCPAVMEAAKDLFRGDVVIGSVHLVRYPGLEEAYSKIDFSALSDGVIADYLDAYFDDMEETLKTTDFDILAHLTCPLRYIVGKYGRSVDLTRYEKKIENILRSIINKGIALEVNTSSSALLKDYMPPREIIEKYRAMGGYLITLGSDAHVAENASNDFAAAIKMLRDMGFSNIYYYKERIAHQARIK